MKSPDQTSVLFSVLCTPYCQKIAKECLANSLPHNKKREKQTKGALWCVYCAHSICQKKCLRMFTKFTFNPTRQKSALYLEKQKSWKNSAKWSHLTTPFKLPAQK